MKKYVIFFGLIAAGVAAYFYQRNKTLATPVSLPSSPPLNTTNVQGQTIAPSQSEKEIANLTALLGGSSQTNINSITSGISGLLGSNNSTTPAAPKQTHLQKKTAKQLVKAIKK